MLQWRKSCTRKKLRIKTISDNSEGYNFDEEIIKEVEEEKEAVKAGIQRCQVDKSNLDNNVTCKYLGNFLAI